ncbi:TPR repeat-containing protein [Desulfatibacillum aliphaticivorans]|uniref:TPR repeat-containing protein n=1 Tax=Desulfatibacillum aliphaticivorans TaxID=218208 RepID=B8FBS8_DESAL|nr:tetratricopeptide repeat protein [Desulfatibacillum aliphaticivorans]ACL04831.1 TPR repeat-containing protein [Desulfatibacillum aliphaticivorans]
MRKYWLAAVLAVVCLAVFSGCGNNDKEFQEAMDKGKAAFSSGTSQAKCREAVDQYTRAVELKPESAQARLARGHVYVKMKDLHKALEDYDKAVSLDPALGQAYFHRALSRIAMGSKEEEFIKADLRKALELDPSIAAASNLLMLYEKSFPGMSQ